MFRNRLIALPLLLACPFAVAACGGDDEPDAVREAVSTAQEAAKTAADDVRTAAEEVRTQAEEATEDARKAADDVRKQAEDATGDADKTAKGTNADNYGTELRKKLEEAAGNLQGEIQALQKKITDGSIDPAEGQKKMAELSKRMQQAIIDAAEALDREGKLPAEAKKQLETMREQLQGQ